MKDTKFDIIAFTAKNERYFPAFMKKEAWMDDTYFKHTEIEIPLGHSRYGGPVVDLPENVTHPEGLRFAAQVDLTKVSVFDKTELLPKTGQLFIFADILTDSGKVIYSDTPNEKLRRQIIEHDDNFWDGVLIDTIASATESWGERFREPEDEWERDHLQHLLNEEGRLWDDFAGGDQSKMFGIFTHCQLGKEKVEEITFSDKIILLQIGENGFNDEGVFSVLISKKDLAERNFDTCEFYWSQS